MSDVDLDEIRRRELEARRNAEEFDVQVAGWLKLTGIIILLVIFTAGLNTLCGGRMAE